MEDEDKKIENIFNNINKLVDGFCMGKTEKIKKNIFEKSRIIKEYFKKIYIFGGYGLDFNYADTKSKLMEALNITHNRDKYYILSPEVDKYYDIVNSVKFLLNKEKFLELDFDLLLERIQLMYEKMFIVRRAISDMYSNYGPEELGLRPAMGEKDKCCIF
jgi:hypothetical protein